MVTKLSALVYLCGVLADGIMHAQFQRSSISPSAMCTRSRGRSTRFFNFLFVCELNFYIRAHLGVNIFNTLKGESVFKMHQNVSTHTNIYLFCARKYNYIVGYLIIFLVLGFIYASTFVPKPGGPV